MLNSSSGVHFMRMYMVYVLFLNLLKLTSVRSPTPICWARQKSYDGANSVGIWTLLSIERKIPSIAHVPYWILAKHTVPSHTKSRVRSTLRVVETLKHKQNTCIYQDPQQADQQHYLKNFIRRRMLPKILRAWESNWKINQNLNSKCPNMFHRFSHMLPLLTIKTALSWSIVLEISEVYCFMLNTVQDGQRAENIENKRLLSVSTNCVHHQHFYFIL